ncbi:type IA DNA topoisomerase [Agrobacterium rubi]|nr:type IA DNA topoisomerase [Agrobacterium rubi]NTF24515.1 type IA DNA topoisomerase [Agrobacterium rubi]
MRDLFVIEAPGKARQLEELLQGLGIEAKVQATKGHLYEMPKRATPLGIDSSFRDFERKLIDPEIGQRLRDAVSESDNVFVATDADQEGDVIAWDVAELISDINSNPFRIRLRGMDPESIRQAIDEASLVSKKDAVPGRTRAIVDRMIGGVFSNNGVAVGRIGSALLGVVSKEAPATRRLLLVAPSKDNGRPWTAECDIKGPITPAIAKKLVEVRFPALDVEARGNSAPTSPANMGQIMVRAGDELDMSPAEANQSMQKLYEAGRLSYPRAGSKGISKSIMRKIARELKKAGYTFDEEKTPDKKATDVHDAPYPIGTVQTQQDPVRQGHEEGLRTLVARDLIKTGQTHVVEKGVGATAAAHLRSKGFAAEVCEHVGKLHWRRETGPRYPGQESWPKSRTWSRRPDTVLLEAAVEKGLGRPSTWANHITKFMERQLVDDDLQLTAKGREWIARTPPILLNPQISAAIEQACERSVAGMMEDPDREPWEILSEKIVGALPPEVSGPLFAAVDVEPPRPKVDPLAPYAPAEPAPETIGLDEILEKTKDYNYGPAMYELPQ